MKNSTNKPNTAVNNSAKTQTNFTSFFKTCFLLFLAIFLFLKTATAQTATQLGPGAGGQERAVYLYKNVAGNYDAFVGSDVSGVWLAKGINPADINNPDQYHYEYISNNEITRFISKFYKPETYSTDYLFVADQSGIDRIKLNDYNAPMENVLPNNEYWTSDIFIGALNSSTK